MSVAAPSPKTLSPAKVLGISADHATACWAELTPREQQIAAELSQGASNQEIAAKLAISSKTLDIHRQNICRKLGKVKIWGIPRIYFMTRFIGLQDKPLDD